MAEDAQAGAKRGLPEIIAHLRAMVANRSVHTVLIDTGDILVLCDAAEAAAIPPAEAREDVSGLAAACTELADKHPRIDTIYAYVLLRRASAALTAQAQRIAELERDR